MVDVTAKDGKVTFKREDGSDLTTEQPKPDNEVKARTAMPQPPKS